MWLRRYTASFDVGSLVSELCSSSSCSHFLFNAPPQINNHNQWRALTDDHSPRYYLGSNGNHERCNNIYSNNHGSDVFKGLHQAPNRLDILDNVTSVTLSEEEVAAGDCAVQAPQVSGGTFCGKIMLEFKRKYESVDRMQSG